MAKRITPNLLRSYGFDGPAPHGEYYLYDPSHGDARGWCIVMCVYPPRSIGNHSKEWALSWNADRGMWGSPGSARREAKARTMDELQRWLHESRTMELTPPKPE